MTRSSRRAASRWVVLGLLLLVLAVLLGAQGLSTRTTGRSATPLAAGAGPLASEGSVLTWDGEELTSRERDVGKRIALTFDDGPDPRWTPRVAAALRRLQAHATFFVVGSKVVSYPEVVQRLRREGFELGNHTFTHADLSALPGWEQKLQLGLTDNTLAGAVGIRPRLFRPPYSSVPAAASSRQAEALGSVARRGYDVVLADFDGEDWRRPGVDEIVASCTTAAATGRRQSGRSTASFLRSVPGASSSSRSRSSPGSHASRRRFRSAAGIARAATC